MENIIEKVVKMGYKITISSTNLIVEEPFTSNVDKRIQLIEHSSSSSLKPDLKRKIEFLEELFG